RPAASRCPAPGFFAGGSSLGQHPRSSPAVGGAASAAPAPAVRARNWGGSSHARTGAPAPQGPFFSVLCPRRLFTSRGGRQGHGNRPRRHFLLPLPLLRPELSRRAHALQPFHLLPFLAQHIKHRLLVHSGALYNHLLARSSGHRFICSSCPTV